MKEPKRKLSDSALVRFRNLNRIWAAKKSELGLTQEKMALKLGFSNQSGFARFLGGYEPIHTDVMINIAKILGVPVTEIDPSFDAPLSYDALTSAFSALSVEEKHDAMAYIAFKREQAKKLPKP